MNCVIDAGIPYAASETKVILDLTFDPKEASSEKGIIYNTFFIKTIF